MGLLKPLLQPLLAMVPPAFDLDLTAEFVDPRVTFTRASTRTYFDSAGTMRTAAANEWPREYDPATGICIGRQVWEQRTNLLVRSQEFGNASWTKYQATVVENAATAPDGTMTAGKLVENTANDSHQSSQAPILAENTSYTLSVYAKAAERNILRLAPTTRAGVTGQTYFNLSSGTVGTIGTGHAASINPVGNGWYRCAITFNSGSGASSNTTRIAMAAVDGSSGYTGDGVSGLLIWGAQLEAASFASPYIPTTTATATRSKDSAVIGNLAAIQFNSAEGTFTVESFSLDPLATGVTRQLIGLDDGSSQNAMFLGRIVSSSATRLQSRASGVVDCDISTAGSFPINQFIKCGFCYKNNDFFIRTDGANAASDSSVQVPPLNRIVIGSSVFLGDWCGPIRRLRYWPIRLNESELQALTA